MNEQKQGILNAIIAYTMWGIYPLYWSLLQSVNPIEILINRMLWSFITLSVVLISLRKVKNLGMTVKSLLANKKKLVLLVLAAAFVSLNWFIYTYAVVSGRLLEASLGYYINPILSVFIGVIFLKERLNKLQIVAIVIASVGVSYLAISSGILPWISIVLALTFGFYGLTKKLIHIDAFFSLFLETAVLFPIATFLFISFLADGSSTFLQPNVTLILLLMGAGFITVSPLFFFSKAAGQLPLKTLGFLQYIGPTIKMLMAVFVLGEDFTTERLITFCFIWLACLIFSTSHLLQKNKPQKKV